MTVGSRYSRVAGSLARFSCCMCVAGKDLHILNSLVFPMHDSLAVWSVRIFVFLSCCNAIEKR